MVEANPYLDLSGDDEDETPTQGASENASIKQIRDYAKRLERENKAKDKEIERLATFEAKARVSTLKEAGLSEKHAQLFLRVNSDKEVTPELVQTFVTEYEIPVATVTTDSGNEPAPAEPAALPSEGIVELNPETPARTPGFAPAPPSGNVQGSVIDSVEEAQKLSVENPAEYARLREAGRIKLQKLPGSG